MKKTSIILPVLNNKILTQTCIDSIHKYSNDYELVIVDDHSEKSTADYLVDCYKDLLIRMDQNTGWPIAVNCGIQDIRNANYFHQKRDKKDGFVVIMNNDTVVTPKWLHKMQRHFKENPKLGILGPTTSGCNNKQHICCNKKGIKFEFTDTLMGFCMMIPWNIIHELYKKDGYVMDEKFGKGGNDDRDLCIRIQKLGYKVGIARDTYIYHYGSATFRQLMSPEESREHAKRSSEYCDRKHGITGNPGESIKTRESREKLKVFIGIPTVSGNIRIELVARLIHWMQSSKYEVHLLPLLGQLPLDNARSKILLEFMRRTNNPNDRLWFIDDDIIPPFRALDVLMEHDKEVVGALCFMMKQDDNGVLFPAPVACRYNENKQYQVYFGGEGLTEIDAFGGGCVMTKRHVFEEIKGRPYKFHYKPDGQLDLVGDYHFCQKVQEAGYKIYVDFACVCEHMKTIGLREVNKLLISIDNK